MALTKKEIKDLQENMLEDGKLIEKLTRARIKDLNERLGHDEKKLYHAIISYLSSSVVACVPYSTDEDTYHEMLQTVLLHTITTLDIEYKPQEGRPDYVG